MVEKAPIVKEYKRAGSFWGAKGTRVLRLLTTFLTLGAGFYCVMYVPFDESHGPNAFTPIRKWYFAKRNEFFGIPPSAKSVEEKMKRQE